MTQNITNIPAPRVPFIDERTGLIAREWFRFLNNQFTLTGGGTTSTSIADLELTPSLASTTEDVVPELEKEIQALRLTPPVIPPVPASYGQFYDTTTQNAAVINTAYAVTFNTTAYAYGMRRGTPTSRIYPSKPGLYDFSFRVQFDKTSGGTANVYVWFRKNGNDIANSASHIHIQGNNAEIFTSANQMVEVGDDDYVELMWSTNDTTIQLQYSAAAAPVPAIPSAILTVSQVNL